MVVQQILLLEYMPRIPTKQRFVGCRTTGTTSQVTCKDPRNKYREVLKVRSEHSVRAVGYRKEQQRLRDLKSDTSIAYNEHGSWTNIDKRHRGVTISDTDAGRIRV